MSTHSLRPLQFANATAAGPNTRPRPAQPAATRIAEVSWRSGALRLMREGWGHYSIVHDCGGTLEMIGEADTAFLAEPVFAEIFLGRSANRRAAANRPAPDQVQAGGIAHA